MQAARLSFRPRLRSRDTAIGLFLMCILDSRGAIAIIFSNYRWMASWRRLLKMLSPISLSSHRRRRRRYHHHQHHCQVIVVVVVAITRTRNNHTYRERGNHRNAVCSNLHKRSLSETLIHPFCARSKQLSMKLCTDIMISLNMLIARIRKTGGINNISRIP